MTDTDIVEQYGSQIAQIKEALRSLLLLKQGVSATESIDAGVAAAINTAFETHAPSFRYDEQSNTQDGKFKVDNAVKCVCSELVSAASAASEHIMEFRVGGAVLPSIPQLLDLARYLSHVLLADTVLFLQLIADLVETCTIDEGTDIFLYLEKCVPFMKAKFNFAPQASTAKLGVLRICNMLLRRLSRARHVLLAGRIHLFLSQILPSTDRSAVNANGMVNDSHAIEVDGVQEGFLGTDGKPVDVGLYKQFWALQQVFQNPTKATDPNLWLQVHASIKALLSEFAKIKPTVASGGINSGSTQGEGGQEGLTVKYLSSPKLLNLQLRDAGFRRHFLVQCLTLLQACSRKSLVKQEVFRIKQQGEADDLQELLYKELERTPHHGPQFAKAIRSLLHHEDQWADWKAGGAQSFERPRRQLEAPPPEPKRRRLNPSGRVLMGARELTRLWNLTPDNLSAIDKSNRRHMPSLWEFLQPVVEQMDPEDAVEEQYKKKNETVYRWEALRQISKVSRVSLSAAVRTQDQNLEEAVKLIFPEDVPGASMKTDDAATPVAGAATMLRAPPSPGSGLVASALKTSSAEAKEEDDDSRLDGAASAQPESGRQPLPAGAAEENGVADDMPERSADSNSRGADVEAAGGTWQSSLSSEGMTQGKDSLVTEDGKQAALGNSYTDQSTARKPER